MGGKSRKVGGVSKKLIAALKAGNYSGGGKKCINIKEDEITIEFVPKSSKKNKNNS